jgi:hypothetical protein
MALPWLESLAWAAPTFPKRFAVLFQGDGINGNHWWAKGSGAEMKLGKTLQVLEPVKSKVNVINGLYNPLAVGRGIHPGQTGNLLSGVPIQHGAIIRAGVTVDQVLAQQIGQDTPYPSLVLACEQPMTGYHETNFSMAYSSHLSWATPESPVPNEVYPSQAFDNLFENRGSLRNLSILDRVMERAGSLSRQVSATDRGKIDEYLTSVREVEKRVERMRAAKDAVDEQARLKGPAVLSMERPQNGLPEDQREHARLMSDIVALAFQTDKTRIATIMLNNDLSQMNFGFLEGVKGSLHLDLTHNGRDPTLEAMYLKTNQFHVARFAYLLERMKHIQEGDGTLLDHSLLMGCSNLFDGDKHQADHMPILLAGHGGGLETGRVLDYLDKKPDDRRACSLYLSLMDRMGVELPRFGDSDRRLADL